ncbi:hypothetical protein [Vreelandella alkaliphila]|uniref:hypothetical protein n=1 Tax=Vreelandella alkaliphila TaxID=272774 RepID=UPI003FD7CE3D
MPILAFLGLFWILLYLVFCLLLIEPQPAAEVIQARKACWQPISYFHNLPD